MAKNKLINESAGTGRESDLLKAKGPLNPPEGGLIQRYEKNW
jgi:hypothetical protein